MGHTIPQERKAREAKRKAAAPQGLDDDFEDAVFTALPSVAHPPKGEERDRERERERAQPAGAKDEKGPKKVGWTANECQLRYVLLCCFLWGLGPTVGGMLCFCGGCMMWVMRCSFSIMPARAAPYTCDPHPPAVTAATCITVRARTNNTCSTQAARGTSSSLPCSYLPSLSVSTALPSHQVTSRTALPDGDGKAAAKDKERGRDKSRPEGERKRPRDLDSNAHKDKVGCPFH